MSEIAIVKYYVPGNISETCFDPFFSKSRTRRSCFASEARATPFHLIPQMDVAVSSPPSPDSVHSPLPRFAEHTFACAHDGCDKRFFRRCDLKKHWRVHTGTKLFACDLEGCGKNFSQLSNLKSHRSRHTGDRLYACDNDGCDKNFRTLSDRANHRRTHTDTKPYAHNRYAKGLAALVAASALQDIVPISKVQATLELKVWLQSVNAMCQ